MTRYVWEKIGPILPPWSRWQKLAVVAVASIATVGWLMWSSAARAYWQSLIARSDSLAGTLLAVHASLLGFALATFAILLSVRRDKELEQLAAYETATRQMWDGLNSASASSGLASVVALFVLLFNGSAFAPWFQSVLAALLFVTTFYVTLAFIGVLAVVHALVILLRPPARRATWRHRDSDDDFTASTNSFQTLGPPPDH